MREQEPISEHSLKWRETLPLIFAFGLALLMVLIRMAGTSSWDLGDGALHYLQVRYASAHTELFFDRWAKPVYVLLGSAFAQLGPLGMVVFNGLIAWGTVWGIVSLVGRGSRIIAWMVPVLLFTSTQYFIVVVSGLTEPLFGLLSIACLWLLWRERYTGAMILLSFAPWVRPEYVVFAPMVILWMLYVRQWKALPWLLFGTVVYFSLGWAIWKERLLHFAKDPYEGGADFGTGPLHHFLNSATEILGPVLLLLACAALIVLPVLWWRQPERRKEHAFIILLAVLPSLGIWAIHSYAYWVGGHASGGLLRVLSTAAPLTLLFVAYTAASLLHGATSRLVHRLVLVLAVVAAGWAAIDLQQRLDLPAKATLEQQLVERAASIAKARFGPGEKIYSMHPYFAQEAGLDIGDTLSNGRLWEADLDRLRPGDLLEWDPKYGPDSVSNLWRTLLADDRFALLSMDLESAGPWKPPFGVWLFERSNTPQTWTQDSLVDLYSGLGESMLEWKGEPRTQDGSRAAYSVLGQEYPLDIKDLKACATGEVLNEWVIDTHIEVSDGPPDARFIWVFTTMEERLPMVTLEHSISAGNSQTKFHQGARLDHRPMRIYLWNIDRVSFELKEFRLTRRCLAQMD